MPWLSVLIPVYNVRDYLHECLASVVDQLGDDLMARLPWHRVDRRPAGTLYRLHERLDDPGVDRTDRAKAILHGIGIDRFKRGLWPDIPRIGTLD